jgi:hypothetical protein
VNETRQRVLILDEGCVAIRPRRHLLNAEGGLARLRVGRVRDVTPVHMRLVVARARWEDRAHPPGRERLAHARVETRRVELPELEREGYVDEWVVHAREELGKASPRRLGELVSADVDKLEPRVDDEERERLLLVPHVGHGRVAQVAPVTGSVTSPTMGASFSLPVKSSRDGYVNGTVFGRYRSGMLLSCPRVMTLAVARVDVRSAVERELERDAVHVPRDGIRGCRG